MFIEGLRSPLLPAIEALLNSILIPFLSNAQKYLQPLRRTSDVQGKVESERVSISKYSTLQPRMPANAWDSHMHVTSPDYPLAASAAYKPSLHSLQHAMKFETTINVSNIVLVQPSIYGNDNSCLLDALKAIGPQHGRGVIAIDASTVDPAALEGWHKLGVRGVRLNLKSTNAQFTEASLKQTLHDYARVIKPFGWVLELFISMEDITMLEPIVSDLGIKLCIAHCGAPDLPPKEKVPYPMDPYDLPGFQSLVKLVQARNTWVKISAAYRFDQDPEMRGIESIVKELLKKAGDRMVFASDWPHTRFEGIDVRPFVEKCLEWTEEAGLTEEVFTRNAEELWDVE